MDSRLMFYCAAAAAANAVSWPSTPVGRGCAISLTGSGSARLRDSLISTRPRDLRPHYRLHPIRAALPRPLPSLSSSPPYPPRLGTRPRRRRPPLHTQPSPRDRAAHPTRPLRSGSPARPAPVPSRLRQRSIAAQAARPGRTALKVGTRQARVRPRNSIPCGRRRSPRS
jgi:hypothetical protein